MRFILFLLLASFSCIQCKNECIDESIKLGNVAFDENTLDHLDFFEGKQSVSFISLDGQIRTYSISKEESTNPILCVEVTCRPTYELEGLNACKYYDTEDRYYTLTSEDLIIYVKAGIELESLETENHYNYIEVGLSNETTSHSAGLITAANYINPTLISNSILSNYFESVIISEKSDYERVLVSESTDQEIYIVFKKGKGIVNYKIDNVTWTLVE